MLLQHLSLTNVRNFVRLEADIPAGPTLLVGANAQGKTSLLEAVYYLARAASPHAQSDRQLINFLALQEATPFARLVAEYRRAPHRPQRVEIRLVLEPGLNGSEARLHREVLLNEVKRRVSDLAAGLHAVLFLRRTCASSTARPPSGVSIWIRRWPRRMPSTPRRFPSTARSSPSAMPCSSRWMSRAATGASAQLLGRRTG